MLECIGPDLWEEALLRPMDYGHTFSRTLEAGPPSLTPPPSQARPEAPLPRSLQALPPPPRLLPKQGPRPPYPAPSRQTSPSSSATAERGPSTLLSPDPSLNPLGALTAGEAVAVDSLFSALIAEAKGLLPSEQAERERVARRPPTATRATRTAPPHTRP